MNEPTPTAKPTLAERAKASPVTFALAAANVLWFVWAEKHGSTTDIAILLRFGAVEPMHVHAGEYWRVASYMFLHIGWAHLLLNTWAGMSWCVVVERLLGSRRFLFVYLLAGVGGGVSCVLFSHAVTAGASGAMFGIIGALLAIRYRVLGSWSRFVADRGVRSTFGQIALWTVIGIVAIPMSQAGHFGGLIVGALATVIMTTRQLRTQAWAIFGIVFAGFTLAALQPWSLLHGASFADADFKNVKIGRMGRPNGDNATAIELAAGPACKRGVQRACVVDVLANFPPETPADKAHAMEVFRASCKAGDVDACGGEAVLTAMTPGVPDDAGETEQLMELNARRALIAGACDAGSEYACEFVF